MVKNYQISTYFKQNKEVHNYDTRNRNKLHVSYKRTDYRKYTVFSKGISIWNCLDEILNHSFILLPGK